MKRRAFIGALAVAGAWPLRARAQQPAIPTIGFLSGGSAEKWRHLVDAFRAGLAELGYVEGKNVRIEYRWAEGDWDRLPGEVAELVERHVTVIATGGGDLPLFAAKAATRTIPIVFTTGSDPVQAGIVDSLSHPAENVTGITTLNFALGLKRLDMLLSLVRVDLLAILLNPEDPPAVAELEKVEVAAQARGQKLLLLNASSEGEGDIDAAFTRLRDAGVGALFVGAGAYFAARREHLVKLAAFHRIPAIYQQREFAEAGGLISYGIDFRNQYRRLGTYAGRILQGAKPSDLPVQQPTKFELVINLKAASALGLTIPPALLATADEVIE